MKRLLAVMLTVVFLVSVTPMAYAFSLEDFFGNAGEYPEVLNLNVDSNMQVKLDSENEKKFVEGPKIAAKEKGASNPTFTFKHTLYMKQVRDAFKLYMTAGRQKAMGDVAKLARLMDTHVTGQFTIVITWPNELIAPDEFTADSKTLFGFNDSVGNIFKETSRTYNKGTDESTLTIVVEVTGPDKLGYVRGEDLENNLETYLPDFTLTCTGVKPDDAATVLEKEYTVRGEIRGYTDIFDGEKKLSTVNYLGVQEANGDEQPDLYDTNNMAATISVRERNGGTNGGGGPRPTATPAATDEPTPTNVPGSDDHDLSFDLGGLGDPIDDIVIPGGSSGEVDLGDIPDPVEDGYDFDGWYFDPAFTRPATGVITVDKDTTLYAKWVNRSVPGPFNNDPEHHFAYIIGYPEGDVRPENNISRDEIATIFYRLLKADYRDTIFTSDNNYSDVHKSWWANKAISSISKGGYMQGYEDGTFRPATPITRAEFATVASRFYESPTTSRKPFSDVSGHWAEEYINAVATMGLVNGYEDGTFRPDAYITRAEAMTIFNRILDRHLNAEGLHKDAVQWPDNPVDAWYYYEVEEATNFHDFKRFDNSYYEDWTAITTNQIWIDKPKYEDPDE